jgi:hypothetical protein
MLFSGNFPSHNECVPFDVYLAALQAIHSNGKAMELKSHFRPQHMTCFKHSTPADWDIVAEVSPF